MCTATARFFASIYYVGVGSSQNRPLAFVFADGFSTRFYVWNEVKAWLLGYKAIFETNYFIFCQLLSHVGNLSTSIASSYYFIAKFGCFIKQNRLLPIKYEAGKYCVRTCKLVYLAKKWKVCVSFQDRTGGTYSRSTSITEILVIVIGTVHFNKLLCLAYFSLFLF